MGKLKILTNQLAIFYKQNTPKLLMFRSNELDLGVSSATVNIIKSF